ncbi:MAG: Gfo/Idh/MocA family oxidoreductase [Verrucomicrobiae bacterium]
MQEKIIRWGIVGPGGIAQKFARDLRVAHGGLLQAVAGRDLSRAKAFADGLGAGLAFDNIQALAAEPSVDIVYIATPHSAHFDAAKVLLQHGKPVLVEKSMTVNAAQARELISIARANRVFLMEAMWTRFLPIYRRVRQWIDDGRIGKCCWVASSFCVRGVQDPSRRWLNLDLAGGGLLDLGVYNLAMTQFVFRTRPDRIHAVANFAETGADEMLSVSLGYGDALAQFACGFAAQGDNSLLIAGEEGRILVPPTFLSAQEATLTVGSDAETIREPFRGEGFEYEIEEVHACLRSGAIESPLMPHSDTLETVEIMDEIRSQIGLRYPFELAPPR